MVHLHNIDTDVLPYLQNCVKQSDNYSQTYLNNHHYPLGVVFNITFISNWKATCLDWSWQPAFLFRK